MAIRPRKVAGDAKRWKALSHPLRQEMLRHLAEHGPATSTTLAEALGENTGTTSYHLRVLADAGVIEEAPGRANGRERWWRTFPTDHREPDYGGLSPEDRAALDEWRAGQVPGELALVHRFIRDVRRHGNWAKASRGNGYFTLGELEALHDDYLALLHKYGHTAEDAPSGARAMQLRMFYIPDEADEGGKPGEPGAAGKPGDAAQAGKQAEPGKAARPGTHRKSGKAARPGTHRESGKAAQGG